MCSILRLAPCFVPLPVLCCCLLSRVSGTIQPPSSELVRKSTLLTVHQQHTDLILHWSTLQQLFCCHFGSPFCKNFIVMLHKFAPQNLITIVWQRKRQKQTQFTSFTGALFLLSLFVIDNQTAFLTRGEPQPAPPRTLSCLANEPSRRHWEVTEILTVIV